MHRNNQQKHLLLRRFLSNLLRSFSLFVVESLSLATGSCAAVTATNSIAIHPRSYGQDEMVCDWMHYLPLLKKRPHAFPYARPLKGWREAWPAVYGRLYDELARLYPTREQFQIFIDILYLRQSVPQVQLEWGIEQALEHHVPHLEGVAYWVRRYALQEATIPPADLSGLPHLTQIGATSGTAAVYDQLCVEVAP